jgi:hypothetical protein
MKNAKSNEPIMNGILSDLGAKTLVSGLAGALLALTGCAAALDTEVGAGERALLGDGDVTLRAEAITSSTTVGAEAAWSDARVLLTGTSPLTWSIGAVTPRGLASGYLSEYIDETTGMVNGEILDASGSVQCYLSGTEILDPSGAPVMELVNNDIYLPGASIPRYSLAADGVYSNGVRLISTSTDQSLTSASRRLLIGALLDGACGLPAAPVDSVTTGPQPMNCGSCTGQCQIVNIFTSQAGAEVDVGGGQKPSDCFGQVADACAALGQWALSSTCGW